MFNYLCTTKSFVLVPFIRDRGKCYKIINILDIWWTVISQIETMDIYTVYIYMKMYTIYIWIYTHCIYMHIEFWLKKIVNVNKFNWNLYLKKWKCIRNHQNTMWLDFIISVVVKLIILYLLNFNNSCVKFSYLHNNNF